MRWGLRAALAAVVVMLVHASTASAQWLAPVTVSPAGYDTNHGTAAMSPNGDAVAVWSHSVNGGSIRPLWVSSRPAGGTWAAPMQIAADSGSMSAVLDEHGNAVAAWNDNDGIVTSSLAPGSAVWSSPTRVVTDATAGSPRVHLSPGGAAVLNYASGVYGAASTMLASIRTGPGAAWTAPQPIATTSAGVLFDGFDVGIDDAGDAVAVWSDFDPSSRAPQPLWLSTRPAGGDWSAPSPLSSAGSVTLNSTMAINRQGEVIAAWYDGQTGSDVHARYRDAAGTWGPDVTVSTNGSGPKVTLDDHGGATVAWTAGRGPETVVAAERAPTGAWSAPTALSATSTIQNNVQVAGNADGDATVMWDANIDDTSNYVVEAATRSGPFGGWHSAQVLSAAGDQSSPEAVGIDGDGDALAAWKRGTEFQISGLDASGPQLRGLVVPATAIVGQPQSFAVSPLDVWSTPMATQWSFGDAGTATGTAVGHTYAAPGAYQVTVTSVDGFGHQTAASQTVNVTAAQTAASPKRVTAKGSVLSPVDYNWRVKGAKLTLTRLEVRNAPAGAKATLSCRGKHCPLKSLRVTKRSHGALDLLKALKRKHTFRAGQTLEVRVTAPQLNGKLVRFRLRAGKVPRSSTYCLPLGTITTVRSCG